MTDASHEAAVKDIRSEAEKYGPLEDVVIPRPNEDLSYKPGVGKVRSRLSPCLLIHAASYREVWAPFYAALSSSRAAIRYIFRCSWFMGTSHLLGGRSSC